MMELPGHGPSWSRVHVVSPPGTDGETASTWKVDFGQSWVEGSSVLGLHVKRLQVRLLVPPTVRAE